MPLEMLTWDVAHGSATFVRTPNGKKFVFDLGAQRAGNNQFSPLRHLRSHYGVTSLDCVVITHPHLDHIDDILNLDGLAPTILRRPSHLTATQVRGGNPPASPDARRKIDKYLELDRRYNNPISVTTSPSNAQNNGGVSFQFFTPTSCPASNLNNHSIVTVISYAESKILLPGDNELPSWDELLRDTRFRQAIRDVDVFVAPHHGREAGFHSALFKFFNPRLTIVSDGPATDTSAVGRYSRVTRGWDVKRRNGRTVNRKCVTTRSDGIVRTELGYRRDARPYIAVTID